MKTMVFINVFNWIIIKKLVAAQAPKMSFGLNTFRLRIASSTQMKDSAFTFCKLRSYKLIISKNFLTRM